MRNTMKVAKWEIKRNLKNKTFLIGLFITPILLVLFGLLGAWFGGGDSDEQTTVYVHDELGVFDTLKATVDQYDLNLEIQPTDTLEADVKTELEEAEDTAYIYIDERAFTENIVPAYTSRDFSNAAENQLQILTQPIKNIQMQELGLTEEQMIAVSQNIVLNIQSLDDIDTGTEEEIVSGEDPLFKRIVPGIFAGIVLMSIMFTGMMIFQSASQEKKDKIAEIILSSVTPNELMQGKIIGYFVLSLIQAFVFIVFALGFALYQFSEFPILEYLFVPELLLFLLISILGYLLFASLFVGIGATMSDVSTAGNFQGFILMIPFVSFFFIGPVAGDPTGLLAQVLSYVPFTSPLILLFRLVMLDQWSWIEIGISLAILIVSVWIMMKLAGKIFKVGMLMYGKNATPGEIWKWIRA